MKEKNTENPHTNVFHVHNHKNVQETNSKFANNAKIQEMQTCQNISPQNQPKHTQLAQESI